MVHLYLAWGPAFKENAWDWYWTVHAAGDTQSGNRSTQLLNSGFCISGPYCQWPVKAMNRGLISSAGVSVNAKDKENVCEALFKCPFFPWRNDTKTAFRLRLHSISLGFWKIKGNDKTFQNFNTLFGQVNLTHCLCQIPANQFRTLWRWDIHGYFAGARQGEVQLSKFAYIIKLVQTQLHLLGGRYVGIWEGYPEKGTPVLVNLTTIGQFGSFETDPAVEQVETIVERD